MGLGIGMDLALSIELGIWVSIEPETGLDLRLFMRPGMRLCMEREWADHGIRREIEHGLGTGLDIMLGICPELGMLLGLEMELRMGMAIRLGNSPSPSNICPSFALKISKKSVF